MNKNIKHPTSQSLIGYIILSLSSIIITVGFMVLPLAVPKIPMFFPSIIGGIGLILLLSRFTKSFKPLPVFITLSPLLLLTGFVWLNQDKQSMPMSDILEIWAGTMVGILFILLLKQWFIKGTKG